MFNTPNMGLTAWDLRDDDFERAKLADNFVAIDGHDHSEGKGQTLGKTSFEPHFIDNSLLAKEAVGAENIKKGSIGTEQLEPGFLPLGTVVSWYRRSGETTLPGGGWEICDGRPWASVVNNLGFSSGNMPDLRGKMIMGADITGKVAPDIGSTGGSSTANVAHSHTVESHSHTVGPHTHTAPVHTHTVAADGVHFHGFNRGEPPVTPFFPMFQHEVAKHTGSPGSGAQALWVPQVTTTAEQVVQMGETGLHAHGGATGAAGGTTGANGGFASGAASPGTNSQLGSISTVPPYMTMLPIMKVR